MRFCITMMLLALPFIALPGFAQGEPDPNSIAIVRFELQMRLGESSVRHSFSQKQLRRLGDGVCIALVRILSEQTMLEPKPLRAFLPMIREAFSEPTLISIEANRKPRVTLMMLDHIERSVSDPQLHAEIDLTVRFVREHTN
jgi:hypothetical protein